MSRGRRWARECVAAMSGRGMHTGDERSDKGATEFLRMRRQRNESPARDWKGNRVDHHTSRARSVACHHDGGASRLLAGGCPK